MDESTACDSEGEDAGSSEHIKESRILLGIARYLLPKIGKGVKTLVLECSKAITNGMVNLFFVIFLISIIVHYYSINEIYLLYIRIPFSSDTG